MATKKLKSLKGRRMRITRLDECGVPVVGACTTVVTSGFITVDFQAEIESGEDYQQKNANGDLEIDEKDPDRIRWINTSISMCEVDPDVLNITANSSLITDAAGTDTIGAGFGGTPNTEAFAIEVWTKQAGRDCVGGTPEYGYFVVPFITGGIIDGGFTIENGVLTVGIKGEGQKATSDWGVGPYGDNPLLQTTGLDVGLCLGVVRTTVAPPAVTAGCVALA
jgi:hypothetical protein